MIKKLRNDTFSNWLPSSVRAAAHLHQNGVFFCCCCFFVDTQSQKMGERKRVDPKSESPGAQRENRVGEIVGADIDVVL